MSILPTRLDELLTFMELHAEVWNTNAAALSIAPTCRHGVQVRRGHRTHEAQRPTQRLRGRRGRATEQQQAATRDARLKAADLIRTIKAFAETQANPAAIYALAQIPSPADAQPVPPPTAPHRLRRHPRWHLCDHAPLEERAPPAASSSSSAQSRLASVVQHRRLGHPRVRGQLPPAGHQQRDLPRPRCTRQRQRAHQHQPHRPVRRRHRPHHHRRHADDGGMTLEAARKHGHMKRKAPAVRGFFVCWRRITSTLGATSRLPPAD